MNQTNQELGDQSTPTTPLRWPSIVCAGLLAVITVAVNAANAVNTTGLPDYPGATPGTMDGVYRSLPSGVSCIHYMTDTPDDLGKVQIWFRGHMAGARETPVNSDHLYGGIFKLDGIKLQQGRDFANIYRSAGAKNTSIELFKCKS